MLAPPRPCLVFEAEAHFDDEEEGKEGGGGEGTRAELELSSVGVNLTGEDIVDLTLGGGGASRPLVPKQRVGNIHHLESA